jgi:transcriptional regulator with XRE-family HTH domain
MVTTDMATIGENLQAIRIAKEMSQQRVATLAGLSVSVVAQIERGAITDPRINTLRALAKALGVDVREFLAGLDEPQPETPKRKRGKK